MYHYRYYTKVIHSLTVSCGVLSIIYLTIICHKRTLINMIQLSLNQVR